MFTKQVFCVTLPVKVKVFVGKSNGLSDFDTSALAFVTIAGKQ